jgi:hypothetical protein
MESGVLEQLTLEDIPRGELRLVDNKVLGDTTELQFEAQDGRLLSITLQDENGNLAVVDVQYPGPSLEVASLRTQLLMSRPLIEFASAWESGDVDSLRAQSSGAFNRLVWSNLNRVPERFVQLPRTLRSPIRKVEETPEEMKIELGRSRTAAMVRMVREKDVWVIDEITLTPGTGPAVQLRRSLRDDLAAQFLAKPVGSVQTAGYATENSLNSEDGLQRASGAMMDDDSDTGGVVRAVGQSVSQPRRGNLTLSGQQFSGPKTQVNREGLDLTPAELPLRKTPQLQPEAAEDKIEALKPSVPGRSVSRAGLKLDRGESDTATRTKVDEGPGDLKFGPAAAAPTWRKPRSGEEPVEAPVAAPRPMPIRREAVKGGSTRALNERPVEIPLE